MKHFLYFFLVCLLGCSSQNDEALLSITDANINLSSSDITPQPDHLRINLQWTPKTSNSNDQFDILQRRECTLKVDPQKIKTGQIYTLPYEGINVDVTIFSLLSNFERYRNIKGKIRFDELSAQTCQFSLFLLGDLRQMKLIEGDSIIREQLTIKSHDLENNQTI